MKPYKQSRELAGALVEDQRRQAVDAAKKRAVAQQVDYDTFKNMVSVAHLKPLQAPSSAPSAGSLLPAWALDPTGVFTGIRSSALSADCSTATTAAANKSSSTANQLHVPSTSQEFAREWRRNCPSAADKYRLLQLCGPTGVAEIFKIEITGELLGQLLMVLQQEWCQQGYAGNCHASSASTAAASSACTAVASSACTAAASSACAAAESSVARADAGHACPTAAIADVIQQRHTGYDARQSEALFVVDLLHGLTGAGRFDLNARLIGSKAKQAATELCSAVEDTLKQQQQRTDGQIITGKSSHTSTGPEQVEAGNGIVRERQPVGAENAHFANTTDSTVQQRSAGQQETSQQQSVQSADKARQQQQQQQATSQQAEQALQRLAYIRRKLVIAPS